MLVGCMNQSTYLIVCNTILIKEEQEMKTSPWNSNNNPKIEKIRFTFAYFVFSLLWMAGLAIIIAVLLPQHLRDVAGAENSTVVFGIFNATSAVASLLSNLIVGNLSDRTRTRFGKRTPWIIFGGILAGISLFLVGIFQNVWLMGISYCFSMVGLNMMIAPAMATLSDRVPESIRATTSAFYSAGTTVGTSLGTLIGARFISYQTPGFVTASIMMGIAGLATIIVWPREHSAKNLPPVDSGFKELLLSFRPPLHGARDFWLAFLGRSLLIFSYYMILNYQLYILLSYIGQGKTEAATTISIMSVVTMIVGLIGSLVSGSLSDKFGRRKMPVNFATILMVIGFVLPWLLKTPFSMILFAGFAGLGYAVYGAVDQALNIDVLPNKEESGKDLGILNIATTLGQTAGPIVTSILVSFGGYNMVFPTAIIFSCLAMVFIQLIRSTK